MSPHPGRHMSRDHRRFPGMSYCCKGSLLCHINNAWYFTMLAGAIVMVGGVEGCVWFVLFQHEPGVPKPNGAYGASLGGSLCNTSKIEYD